MKEVEYFRWLVPSTKPRGKPWLTKYHLNADDAAQRYPGATPSQPSREVRMVCEEGEDAISRQGNVMAGTAAGGGRRPI